MFSYRFYDQKMTNFFMGYLTGKLGYITKKG